MADGEFLEMLNPRHRAPQIQWRHNKTLGVIVCLLFRCFEKDNKAFERIFSAIFQKELREYGFTSSALFDRLNSRLVHMRDNKHVDWLDIFEEPFDKNGVYSGLLGLIQDTAACLKIQLKEKECAITKSGYSLDPLDTSAVSFELLAYKPFTNYAHRMRISLGIYLPVSPRLQSRMNT